MKIENENIVLKKKINGNKTDIENYNNKNIT